MAAGILDKKMAYICSVKKNELKYAYWWQVFLTKRSHKVWVDIILKVSADIILKLSAYSVQISALNSIGRWVRHRLYRYCVTTAY